MQRGTLDTAMRGRAERRCANHPVGSSIVAFYDPANPSRACLERISEGTWIFGGIGAAFAAVGSLHLLGIIRIGDQGPPRGWRPRYSPSASSSRRSIVSAYSCTSSSTTLRTDFTWFSDPTTWPTK